MLLPMIDLATDRRKPSYASVDRYMCRINLETLKPQKNTIDF